MLFFWRRDVQKWQDLDEQLRAAVRKLGLTGYALAKGAGFDQSQAIRWLKRERTMTLTTASKIATFLQLELRPVRRGK
jgi:hypothetical protein